MFRQPMRFGNRNTGLLKPAEVTLVGIPTHQSSVVLKIYIARFQNGDPCEELRQAKVIVPAGTNDDLVEFTPICFLLVPNHGLRLDVKITKQGNEKLIIRT